MLSFIRNDTTQDFENLADSLDCLILTGGDDSTLRRIVEIKIAKLMLQRNKPIIGVCHGAFLLTDLMGGVVSDVITHMDTSHEVWYFGERKIVNSYHNEGHCESWIDGKIAAIVWHPERMEVPWLPDEIENLLRG